MNEVTGAMDENVSDPHRVSDMRVTGEVKWFNVKSGYGFIHRHDTDTDIFVHETGIGHTDPKRSTKSLREGEQVEFCVVEGEKGDEAHDVTGPGGAPVQGSVYASPRGRGQMYMRGGRGYGGYGMTFYGQGGRGGHDAYGNYGYMDRGGRGRPFRGRPFRRPFFNRVRGGYMGGGPRGENGNGANHHDEEHQHQQQYHDYQHEEHE